MSFHKSITMDQKDCFNKLKYFRNNNNISRFHLQFRAHWLYVNRYVRGRDSLKPHNQLSQVSVVRQSLLLVILLHRWLTIPWHSNTTCLGKSAFYGLPDVTSSSMLGRTVSFSIIFKHVYLCVYIYSIS